MPILFREVLHKTTRRRAVASGNPWMDDAGRFASPDGGAWSDIPEDATREHLFMQAFRSHPDLRHVYWHAPKAVTSRIEAAIAAGNFDDARAMVRAEYGGIDLAPPMERVEALRLERAPQDALQAFHARYLTRNPFDEREILIGDGTTTPMGAITIATQDANYRFPGSKPAIYGETLRAITPGGGSVALRALLELADEYRVDVAIYARTFNNPPHTKSQRALVRWYREWGFVNEGASDGGQPMIRHPGTPMRERATPRVRKTTWSTLPMTPAIERVLQRRVPRRPYPRALHKAVTRRAVASGNPWMDDAGRFASPHGTALAYDDGTPVTLYHGSDAQLTAFDDTMRGAHTGASDTALGMFLTLDPAVAARYGKHAHEVTLQATWDDIVVIETDDVSANDPYYFDFTTWMDPEIVRAEGEEAAMRALADELRQRRVATVLRGPSGAETWIVHRTERAQIQPPTPPDVPDTEEGRRAHVLASATIHDARARLATLTSHVELLVAADTDGTVRFAKQGSELTVAFTDSEMQQFRGRTLVHNHPQGYSLSDDDVAIALVTGARSIEAIVARSAQSHSAESFALDTRAVRSAVMQRYDALFGETLTDLEVSKVAQRLIARVTSRVHHDTMPHFQVAARDLPHADSEAMGTQFSRVASHVRWPILTQALGVPDAYVVQGTPPTHPKWPTTEFRYDPSFVDEVLREFKTTRNVRKATGARIDDRPEAFLPRYRRSRVRLFLDEVRKYEDAGGVTRLDVASGNPYRTRGMRFASPTGRYGTHLTPEAERDVRETMAQVSRYLKNAHHGLQQSDGNWGRIAVRLFAHPDKHPDVYLREYRATVREVERVLSDELQRFAVHKAMHFSDFEQFIADDELMHEPSPYEPAIGIRNQYTTGTSNGMFAPGRRRLYEDMLFGYQSPKGEYARYENELDEDEAHRRPVYGYLAPRDVWQRVHSFDADEVEDTAFTSGIWQYGDVQLVLKPHVNARTTFTDNDSLARKPDPFRDLWEPYVGFLDDEYDAVVAERVRLRTNARQESGGELYSMASPLTQPRLSTFHAYGLQAAFWPLDPALSPEARVLAVRKMLHRSAQRLYLETQTHGAPITWHDIESVHFTYGKPTHVMRAYLKARGIPFTVGESTSE